MHKYRVLITWRTVLEDFKIYEKIFKKNKIKADFKISNQFLSEKQLLNIIHEYDGIICGDDKITNNVIQKANKLKVITKWGTGLDSIDLISAKKMGIKVFNTPAAFTQGVTEIMQNEAREEAESLWQRGIGRHLTPKDVLVIGDDGPIENEYRFDDEPVRHKVLDAIGDLYLVGCPVRCRILAFRSGHGLNRRMGLRIREQMAAADRQSSMQHGRVMDIKQILRLLPHCYPMLLVDRVVEMDGDRKAVGVKNVTINEQFLQGHYPGTPIMPGVLLIEAMAQLGGLLLSRKLEHTGKLAVLLSLDKCKLRKPVVPGDQVVLEAESLRVTARLGHVRCRALVDDKVAAEADIKFMLVDNEQD